VTERGNGKGSFKCSCKPPSAAAEEEEEDFFSLLTTSSHLLPKKSSKNHRDVSGIDNGNVVYY
jgi:hypothetical protein